MAVTADFDAQSAVERELVLRLASLFWRLRRASAIEAGLFNIQARELLGRRRRAHREHHNVLGTIPGSRTASDDAQQSRDKPIHHFDEKSSAALDADGQTDAVTRSFLQLTDLPTSPLDRLSRYEATLWRQACQILWTLQCLDRRRPWERRRPSQSQF